MEKKKRPIFKIPCLIIFAVLIALFAHSAFAETKTFIKKYSYQASEIDSKVSCRAIALEQVKRLLLEELGTYLESQTEVKNFQISRDQIITLTAGILSTEIVDETWDGKTYVLKAKITANPKDVSESIDKLRQDRQKIKELEEMRNIAAEALREVEKLKKELETTKVGKAEQYKYQEAINRLSAVDWLQTGLSLVFSGLGIDATAEGKYLVPLGESVRLGCQKAVGAFDKAIELDPKLAKTYYWRGFCFSVLGDFQKAIKDYDNAIALDPKNASAYFNRAISWNMLNNEGKAIHDYDKAIDLDSELPQIYYQRGSAYLVLGDYQRAISDLSKAIERDPKDAGAYNNRANAYYGLGKYRQAIEDCDKAIELDPKAAQAYSIRGSSYRRLNDYKKGIEDAAIASRLGDKQARNLLKLAGTEWNFSKKKQPREALIVCMVEKEWEISLKLDYSNKIVNGIPANLADSEIRWLFPVFPEDLKIDESGKKSIHQVWLHVLNRHSGSLNIGNVLSGQCSGPGIEISK